MTEILTFAILGAASGSVLAMLGIGVNVIYRSSRVMNFSQVAIAVTAAYAYSDFTKILPTPVALLFAIVVGIALGAFIDAVIMRPLRRSSSLTKAIATIGVLLVLQAGLNIRYGYNPILVTPWLPTETVTFFGVTVGLDRLLTIAVVLLVALAVYLFYKKSPLGLASTALSVNPRALAALGTQSPTLVSLTNWMISGGLAALAGLLLAPVTSLSPSLALVLIVPVLSVALLGNLQSFGLTLVGGLFIGIAQSLISISISIPGVQDAVPFLVIAILLTLRGSSMPARGETAERLPLITPGRIPWTPMLITTAVVAVLVLFVLPENWVAAITISLVVATVLLSIVVVTGYAGQLNLASFAFAGVAALVAALMVHYFSFSFLPAALVGVLATIPIGLLVGLPAVRTRGTALAVITLGLAVAFQSMVLNNSLISNGIAGYAVGDPTLFGMNISAIFFPRRYAIFVLIVFVLLGIMVLNLRRSGAGRRMVAVRGNEAAAASVGVSVPKTKLFSFVVSAAIAGVGGVLIAFMNLNIVLGNPGGRFDPSYSINAIAQSTVGGIGWVGGTIAGSLMEPGAVLNLVLRFLTEGAWLNLISGVLLLVTVVTAPAGIAAIQAAQFRWLFSKLPGAAKRAAQREAKLPTLDMRDIEVNRVEPATLSVHNLSIGFSGNPVLNGIDLDITPGQVLGVIGPNGAGKTTLLEAITGYNSPQSGTIRLNGEDISRLAPVERARRGVVRSFQSLELFEDLSVYDNMLVASDTGSFSKDLIAGIAPGHPPLGGAATAAVAAFGFSDRLHDSPSDLSYGERRLLAIARALATRPRVLLLDEPAAGLGATERAELRRVVRRIADEWGIAVFLIEHDVELVMEVSDEVVALDFGTVIARGAPKEVRNHPAVIAAYLGAEEPVENSGGLNTSFVTVVQEGNEYCLLNR